MSITNKTINSSFLILITRLIQRSLGIISLLVLVRLLSPEDFGVVAIASMVVFFCDVLSETGAQQYLIQKETLERDDINSAWTLNFIFKTSLAIILFFVAPWISIFFENTTLTLPIQTLCIILPISAVTGPGMILLKREFTYQPILRLFTAEKIVSVIFSISLAFILETYWAMIFGVIFSFSFRAIGSYFVHGYRPSFCIKQVSNQWQFSKWMLFKAMVGYSKSEMDTVFIMKFFGLSALGGYNLMKNLSMIPGREIIQPLTEPLLSAFSRSRDDVANFQTQIINSLITLLFITSPICLMLFEYDVAIVNVFFDEEWYSYAPILGFLSVFIINYTLVGVLQESLIAIGKVKVIFYYDLVSLLITAGLLTVFFNDSLMEFTQARVLIAVCFVIVLCLIIKMTVGFSLLRLVTLSIPIVGGSYITSLVTNMFVFEIRIMSLLINLTVSSVTYLLSTVAIFYLLRPISFYKPFNSWVITTVENFIKSHKD